MVCLFARLCRAQGVDFHVVPQVARSGEGSGAFLARVGLLLDVGHAVVVEVGGGGEALAAYFTNMRFLTRVNIRVVF